MRTVRADSRWRWSARNASRESSMVVLGVCGIMRLLSVRRWPWAEEPEHERARSVEMDGQRWPGDGGLVDGAVEEVAEIGTDGVRLPGGTPGPGEDLLGGLPIVRPVLQAEPGPWMQHLQRLVLLLGLPVVVEVGGECCAPVLGTGQGQFLGHARTDPVMQEPSDDVVARPLRWRQ